MESWVGDFLIKSIHDLRTYSKNLVFFDVWVLSAAISKLVFVFFTHFAAEGRTFFLTWHFFSAPVERFRSPGQSAEGNA